MRRQNSALRRAELPYLLQTSTFRATPNSAAMFQFSSIVQKAQSIIDPSNFSIPSPSFSSNRTPSKAALFRQQFRLPDSQSPLQEITAELVLPLPHSSSNSGGSATAAGGRANDFDRPGNRYTGTLHLSERFLCFSTQPSSFLQSASYNASTNFTGQTHGTGPSGNGFTLPLCSIRRVERLNSLTHIFSLSLTTWNGALSKSANSKDAPPNVPQKFTIQLSGSRQACERFCDGLKKGLREGMKDVEALRLVVADCYSEYLLTGGRSKPKDGQDKEVPPREPPDAGLGMVFRYPGDARKLRDRSKMRLWGEYMRGMYPALCTLSVSLDMFIEKFACRERPKSNHHPPTNFPQADPSWTTESLARRDLGTYIRVNLRSISLSETLHGNSCGLLWPRITCYR